MNATRRFTRFVCLLSAVVFSVASYAATLNVPSQYPNLNAAIAAASAGDTIIVADGTYTGPDNRNLVLNNKNITIQSESRDPTLCTIDCENSAGAFSCTNGDGSTIEGFTICNGSSTYGSALYIVRSSPTLRRCILTNHVATVNGGAVHVVYAESTPSFIDCVFTGNQAANGGAVSAYAGCIPVFENCEFRDNHATGHGGALRNEDGSCRFTLVNCEIVDNTAGGQGGGGYFEGGATLRRCRISGNSAGECGGGVYASYKLDMSACVVQGNSAGNGWAAGGVYYYEYGSANLGYITSCLITGNSSGYAGGLYVVTGGNKYITNCTVADNYVTLTTGGIYGSNATVTNCIVRGNSTPQIEAYNTPVSYSDVEGGFAGDGNFDLDPLFANPDNGNYHLVGCSPCIDTGDPNYVPWPGETDMDGQPRVMDGSGGGEVRVDVGCDEVPTDWYDDFDDADISDWQFENPYPPGDSAVTMELSTAQYTSAPCSMHVNGPKQDFYGGFAHGPALCLPTIDPYVITFQFRYHQFHWYHLLLIGPVQLTMDYPEIQLRYRDDGPTWNYLGTAEFGSYCSPDTWTEFQVEVNPPTHTYDVYVNGVFRGRADYQSFTTSEDGFGFVETGGNAPNEADYIVDGYYDDLAVTAGGWHDCNTNGLPDGGDIASGSSQDANRNGIPDECQEPVLGCRGDMNCDGTVGFGDINPFVHYLSNFSGWQALFPGCNPMNGDTNQDGTYPSFGDINAFVGLLSTNPIPQCP